MAEPFSRFLVGIRIVRHLIDHLDFHFVDSHARSGVVRNVEIYCERRQLLELHLIDGDTLFVGQRQLQLPVLTAPEILDNPLHSPLRDVEVCSVCFLDGWLLRRHHRVSRFHIRASVTY